MFPLGKTKRSNESGKVTPEEVLLQVTLAFTVILGFLLSDENAFNATLGHKLTQAEQVYGELRTTGKDALVEQADLAAENAERMRLLNAWITIRSQHPLFCQIQILEQENGPLALLSSTQLLSDKAFLAMRDDTNRLFGHGQPSDEPGDNLAQTIALLTGRSVEEAGYHVPQSPGELPGWLNNSEPIKAMGFLERHARVRARIASWENVRFLLDEIHGDFDALRRRAARVQLRAVRKIAESKAAQGPNAGVSADPNRSLVDLLDELDADLKLLPEVRQELQSAR
jgi:hypothetical protein